MEKITASPNACIATANLACYIGITAIFFSMIGAKQYDMTLRDKAEYARLFTKHASEETKEAICKARAEYLATISEAAAEQQKKRTAANNALLRYRIGPIVLVCLILSVIAFMRSTKPGVGPAHEQWMPAHSYLLGVVILCFVSELFVFGGVLMPLDKMGDFEIAAQLTE